MPDGLTLSGRYPASGTDGWELNPPHTVLETASPPWNIRPYIGVGTALRSCPSLALRGKPPSLAVVCLFRPPMPHISPTETPLHTGVERRGEGVVIQSLTKRVSDAVLVCLSTWGVSASELSQHLGCLSIQTVSALNLSRRPDCLRIQCHTEQRRCATVALDK